MPLFLSGQGVPLSSSSQPTTAASEDCPPNQTRVECPPCQLTCDSINIPPPENCTPYCVAGGVCICQVDWYFNDGGVCVPHVLCPKPVQTTNPNPCQVQDD